MHIFTHSSCVLCVPKLQVKLVIGLSDWLSLNEIECLRLFIEISDRRNFPSSDIDTAMRVVAGHYLDTRKAILQALYSTLYLVVSESIFELQEWISDYIESLIQPSENSSTSLLERLTALITHNPLIVHEDGFDANQVPYIVSSFLFLILELKLQVE